jgi:hypothetical protein
MWENILNWSWTSWGVQRKWHCAKVDTQLTWVSSSALEIKPWCCGSCLLCAHKNSAEAKFTTGLGPTRPWRSQPTFLRVSRIISFYRQVRWHYWNGMAGSHTCYLSVRFLWPFISRLNFKTATCPRFASQQSSEKDLIASECCLTPS